MNSLMDFLPITLACSPRIFQYTVSKAKDTVQLTMTFTLKIEE